MLTLYNEYNAISQVATLLYIKIIHLVCGARIMQVFVTIVKGVKRRNTELADERNEWTDSSENYEERAKGDGGIIRIHMAHI